MAEPFPLIRRNRPAASTATYGRKAMAARRRLVGDSVRPVPITKPAAFSDNNNNISSSLDSDNSSSDDNDSGTNQLRERRTVRSAMSKLESLYNSTKNLQPASSSLPRDIFDATKDRWDLGDDIDGKTTTAAEVKIKKKSKPVKKAQRKVVRNKPDVTKPKLLPPSKVIKSSSKIPTPPAIKKTKASTSSSPVVDSDSKVWDMSHLLESSPIVDDSSICILDQNESSDHADITVDITPRSKRTQRQIYRDPKDMKTPNVTRTVRNQGPSVDSAKRLQSRAYAHNVVFTYGRNRDDSDGLALELGKAIGHHQPLFLPDLQLNVKPAAGESSHQVGPSFFAQQLGGIIQGLNSTPAESCRQLLDRLEQTEFRGELFGSKYWLSMLLQGLGRVREEPMVSPTTILVISLAFCIPTLMQTLVLEKQVLETVAEILTLALTESSDMLSLRRKSDFDDPAQYRCVSTICRIAHKCDLLGNQAAPLPLSTYHLVLCALQRFLCTDDAAYLAMAPWLRSETHESGCLGLIVERATTWSIPTFIGRYGTAGTNSNHDKGKWVHMFTRNSNVDMSRQTQIIDHDDDTIDMWMDFDLPEEEKETPKVVLAATSKSGKKALGRGGNIVHEPKSNSPTYASISLELELLRFCSGGSVDSQGEILSVDSCVSSLILLLTTCYLASATISGFGEPLINALETATLTLQLLVNLSNSSTLFCAKFRECDGLSIAAKSVAIAAQQMDASPQHKGVANHYSPKRKALLSADENKEDIGDLHYDILLTTSALLTNVVDSDPSSALFFDHIQQSPRCTLTRQCFPDCSCIGCLSLTNLLIQAFLSCQKATPADNCDAAIAAGYLAVLLGVLLRQRRSSCRDKILALLPKRDGKSLLIQHIQQLATLSEAVTRRFGNLFGGLSSSLNPLGAIDDHDEKKRLLLLEDTSDSPTQALQPRQQQQQQSNVVSALKSLVASLEDIG